MLALTLLAFGRVVRHGFLNWDDPDVLLRNPALDGPDVVGWAFSTTHVSHYQPLSWLAWAAVRRLAGLSPVAHHLVSLLGHLLNTALVHRVAGRLAVASGGSASSRTLMAAAAAVVFAVHPLRVEPVAWASGLPYVLAVTPLLLGTLAYLRHAVSPGRGAWLLAALAGYLVSLLFRPVAVGFPLVLALVDFWLARRNMLGVSPARAVLEKAPFAVLALAAAAVEASARPFVGLERISLGVRLADAALAPFVYLLRTLLPIGLSPLHPLLLDARTSWPALMAGLLLLATASALVLRARRRWPSLVLAWFAYLALLAPALGLAPSGLQATADRYTYVPGVVVALASGGALAALSRPRPQRTWLALTVVATLLAVSATGQLGHWRDSVRLWTRAVELDPRNDVALYNLASALAEAGREAEAAARYRELLRLLPDHGPARHNMAVLEAERLERQANELASAGRLDEAARVYGQALAHDPARLHSRASRGMALATLGRFADALPDLETAFRAGRTEPALARALAMALIETGARDPRALETLALASAAAAGPDRVSPK